MASVANRLAAQIIDHANHRSERRVAKIGAAKIDLAKQAIPTPCDEGKIVRSENDFTRRRSASPDTIEKCR
jgi:hypothetical protein